MNLQMMHTGSKARATVLAVAATGLLASSPASGEAPATVVIPIGKGPSLYATARVARSITKLLNRAKQQRQARIYYPLPTLPAAPPQVQRKAQRLLKSIQHAYRMMEYIKVATLAEQATKPFKQLLKSGRGRDDYVEILHYKAAAALFEGKRADALRAMNDAHLLDPRPPAPKEFSPQVQEVHQQVLTTAPARGGIRPTSSPQSLVWLNDRLIGPAFGTTRVRSGLYLVRFYRPGHLPYQRWFRVHPNKVRDLHAMLTADTSTEPEAIAQLRAEAKEPRPGTLVNQLTLDQGASDIILVAAMKGCSETSCKVVMLRAKNGRWIRRRAGSFRGKAAPVAALLLKRKRPLKKPRPAVARARVPAGVAPILPTTCTLDNQCGFDQVCRDGQCVTPAKPVTRKWWFWTLVGAAVAGATVGIVVPLTRPGPPVIDVR